MSTEIDLDDLALRVATIQARGPGLLSPPGPLVSPPGPKPGSWEYERMRADERALEERRVAAKEEQDRLRLEREAAEAAERQRVLENAPKVARLKTERRQLVASRQPHLDRAETFTMQIHAIDAEIRSLL
jgi:hypothetical protein